MSRRPSSLEDEVQYSSASRSAEIGLTENFSSQSGEKNGKVRQPEQRHSSTIKLCSWEMSCIAGFQSRSDAGRRRTIKRCGISASDSKLLAHQLDSVMIRFHSTYNFHIVIKARRPSLLEQTADLRHPNAKYMLRYVGS